MEISGRAHGIFVGNELTASCDIHFILSRILYSFKGEYDLEAFILCLNVKNFTNKSL